MRVTTWTEYSLIISIHLAKRGRKGSGPVAARELADTERLPADYVEQVLLRLRPAGLVGRDHGPKSGGWPAQEKGATSVPDNMASLETQRVGANLADRPAARDPA